jgi:hypothetical protein
MTDREKHVAKMERKQQRLEAGLISDHFPEVSSIGITMTDKQKGVNPTSILRTFNFTPNSYAYFYMGCLNKECVEGGFDLSQVITAMIKYHKELEEGELICDGNNRYSNHSKVHYKISIEYIMSKNSGAEDIHKESRLENLRVITKILFDHNGTARDQLTDESRAKLIESISYLEKSKAAVSDSCKKEIDSVIDRVRYRFSDLKGGMQ